MIRVAICDDDGTFTSLIKRYIEKLLADNRIDFTLRTFCRMEDFFALGVKISGIDVVFLNINMKSADGVKTLAQIKDFHEDISIIVVADNACYAVEGYRLDIARYILKNDVNFADLLRESLLSYLSKKKYVDESKKFQFVGGEKTLCSFDIMYVESRLHLLRFHIGIEEQIYTMYGKLNDWEKELKKWGFIRIHQSFLVNSQHIVRMEKKEVVLRNDERLTIPKARYQEVKDAVDRLTKGKANIK